MKTWERSESGGASRFVVTIAACMAVLALLAVLMIRHVLVDIPAKVVRRASVQAHDTAVSIAEDVAKAFQVRPKVTIGTMTIVEQESPVAQFAVLERQVSERYSFSESWLHSTKTFEVEGRFLVRAGYDLKQPFTIELNEMGDSLEVRLPRPQVLGAELVDLKILRDENGLWNKLTTKDREKAIDQLRKQALFKAYEDHMPARAQAEAEREIKELLGRADRTVIVESAARSEPSVSRLE